MIDATSTLQRAEKGKCSMKKLRGAPFALGICETVIPARECSCGGPPTPVDPVGVFAAFVGQSFVHMPVQSILSVVL